MLRTSFIIIILGFSKIVLAQGLKESQDINEEIWINRVKLLTQFINRFNNTEDLQGNDFILPKNQEERKKTIARLFNYDMMDSLSKLNAMLFISDVCSNFTPQSISFRDKAWYARLSCNGNLHNKKVDVDLSLQIQHNIDNSVEWIIVGGYCDELEISPNKEDIFLAANVNELNFLRLITGLEKPENAFEYTSTEFYPDYLSILLYLIKCGELKLMTVQSITYDFLQIPGWIFSVNEKEEQSTNSGWLISNLQKADQKTKLEYKMKKLHLTKLD